MVQIRWVDRLMDYLESLINVLLATTQTSESPVMELLALHGDVLAEIFVAVHASGESAAFIGFEGTVMELLALHGDVLAEIFVTVHASGESAAVMEFLALHGDVLAKIFIAVHASGESAAFIGIQGTIMELL